MQHYLTIQEARERAYAMQQELQQAENMVENLEEELDMIDWIFAFCLQAQLRNSKRVYFPKILAKARGKVRQAAARLS